MSALSTQDFNNVIREIKNKGVSFPQQLVVVTQTAMSALGVSRDLTQNVSGIPAGEDEIDEGSIYSWINNIQVGDSASITQLTQIDATAQTRLNG